MVILMTKCMYKQSRQVTLWRGSMWWVPEIAAFPPKYSLIDWKAIIELGLRLHALSLSNGSTWSFNQHQSWHLLGDVLTGWSFSPPCTELWGMAERRADCKDGVGAASEEWGVIWVPWQEALNSQGAAWEHFVPEEGGEWWKKGDEHKLPHFSRAQDDGWLVIFCISSGAAKMEPLYWDQRLKLELCGP